MLHNQPTTIFFFTLLLIHLPQFTTPNPFPDYPCQPPHHNHPFCDQSLPIQTRATSLISLLTLSEKITQLSNNASSIPNLGIPSFQWWSESLHGIATNGPGIDFNGTIKSATDFPQVIVSASSFNRSLWFLIGAAVAVEGRAMYNEGQAGLTYWAPNVNIFRDPRWGRGQETPGEDPMVASAYAVEFVRGFEGGKGIKKVLSDRDDDGGDEEIMLSACCKHFNAYDLEKWGQFARYNFNAVVSQQDLEDSYQPPFRGCVQQGKASCLMCSYNAVNGVPACVSEDLMGLVRNKWGFEGYITSDCDAVATVFEYQHYAKSPEEAVAEVLKAGVDINCGTYMLRHTGSAVEQGMVKEEDLDRALLNLFSVQMRLGLFNGDPRKGKYGKLGPQDVCTPEHKKLALEAARQGIVLLKNDNKFLPLDRKADVSLAVIGPMANTTKLGGGYSGIPCSPKSLYDGLKEYAKTISYAIGCRDVQCNSDDGFAEAIDIAKEADFVVIVAGLSTIQETEDLDRVSLLLPGKQMELVLRIAVASKRPVILVLTGGGPLDVSSAVTDNLIASILWVGYPGEAGGKALAEIIFGEINPAGRLPMTWYPESFTSVPMNDMRMRADPSRGYPGRTYRFYTGSRIYGFGHGLSYSDFSYRILSAPSKISLSRNGGRRKSLLNKADQEVFEADHVKVDELQNCNLLSFLLHVSVMNLGDMDGSHVVMLFSKWPKVIQGSPENQLVGFSRVHTVSNEPMDTSIFVDPCEHLSFADEQGKRILPLGNHILNIGDVEHIVSIEIF